MIKTLCCNVVMNLMTLFIVSYMADNVAIFSSYTMGTSGLPDIYTRGLRVYISGKPRVYMV